MSYLNAIPRTAGEREAGVSCPHCGASVGDGAAVIVCQACGTVHHEHCWSDAGKCGSYVCSPGRRDLSADPQPALVITTEELERTPILPARQAHAPTAPPPPTRPRTSRLAIAALVCAVAGIPLFGVLTGFVAILLGSLALGSIHRTRQKGVGFALIGVLLGLGDMVGWIIFLAMFLPGLGERHTLTEFRSDLTALDNLDPKIGRAMRANVMIESKGGLGILGGTAIGSGVILKLEGGEALILTNRHVVDAKFSGEADGKEGGKPDKAALKVQLVDESVHPGEVVWIAPDGIDLALIRVACRSKEARATRWKLGRRRVPVGGAAFAIGNPQGLGWTHTQGTISQYRIQDLGGREVPVIQTQTVINPGNSGGGLYDGDGYLIGINTWTQDKRTSEGLNFAIGLEVLSKLAPPFLDLQAGFEGPDQP